MDRSSKALSQAHTHFNSLIEKYELVLRRRTQNIVYYSNQLQSPDEDDIYVLALMKLWKAYFAPNALQKYEYRSDNHDKALLRRVLEHAAVDVIRLKDRINLPTYFNNPEYSFDSYSKVIGTESFTTLIDLEIDIEDAINNAITNPIHKLVAYYLLGKIDREQLKGYSDSYIRVMTSRVRKKLLRYLDGEA